MKSEGIPQTADEWRELRKTSTGKIRERCDWEIIRSHRETHPYHRGLNRGWEHASAMIDAVSRLSNKIPWPPEPIFNNRFKWSDCVRLYCKASNTGMLNVVGEVWERIPETVINTNRGVFRINNDRIRGHFRFRIDRRLFQTPLRVLTEVRWALEDSGLMKYALGTQWDSTCGLGVIREGELKAR